MKSKPQPKEKEPQSIDKEPSFEVRSEGPSIASAKRNKFLVISASVALISFVYFFFFSGEEKTSQAPQNLESVEPPKKAIFAKSDDGSPFEFKDPKKVAASEGVEILEKPATPDIPTIPDLPEDASAIENLILAPKGANNSTNAVENGVNGQSNPSKINQNDPNNLNNPNNQNNLSNPNQQNFAEQNLPNQNLQNVQTPVNPTSPANSNQTLVNSNPPASEEQKKEEEPINPRYSPIIVFSGSVGTNMRGIGYENNIINLKHDAVDGLTSLEDKTRINKIGDRVHTIAQGKFLSAVIETAITTEMPGDIRGIIDRDVYGESGKEILLPRGTRIFGTYSASVRRGQGRVEIAWSRLLRQDGVSIAIAFVGSDQFGRAGVQGEVDNKYSSIIANSLLTSALAIGSLTAAQGIMGDNNATTTISPTLGTTTTTGNAANQALYDVTKSTIGIISQILQNSIDLNPIIRIPQGTRVTVIVNSDLRIPSMKKTNGINQ